MKITIIILLYASLFLFGEFVHRFFKVRPEGTRRTVHFLSALLATLVVLWLTRQQIFILATAFFLFLVFSRSISLLKSIHHVERKGLGELFFPLGVILAAFLFLPSHPSFYMLSLLILAISDPLASWVGSKSVNYISGYLKKSWAGSIAFFISSLCIALIFVPLNQAITIALFAMLAELVGVYGSDNVSIILGVYLGIYFLK